jgi:GLPGLI family protein
MMTKNKPLFVIVITASLLSNSCSTGLLQNRVSEGVIEYELSFPDYDPSGIMAGMLPERTTLTFRDNKQVQEVNAGMGIFRTSMITDNQAESMDYHLSLMSKKMVAHLLPLDFSLFNTESGKPTIIFTQDVDTIAGYACKRAVAIYDKVDEREIELWYTDQIRMTNPNWYSPFAEIKGVLLRYDMVQYGMRMRLDAISVTAGEVDQAKFVTKTDYTSVPAAVLHHELKEVMGTFSM